MTAQTRCVRQLFRMMKSLNVKEQKGPKSHLQYLKNDYEKKSLVVIVDSFLLVLLYAMF